MGGKFRQGPAIAAVVARALTPGCVYFEPFCGACGSAYRVAPLLPLGVSMRLSDSNEALVNMWRSVMVGWDPPDVILNDVYDRLKQTRDPLDPLTAYYGFGASFGGKWFGGYARDVRGGSGATNTKLSIRLKAATLLKASVLRKVSAQFMASDYAYVKGVGVGVWYLDPPYRDTTKAHGVKFDHIRFWTWARGLVLDGNKVIVTEFMAPDDFVSVYSWGDTAVRHHGGRGGDGTDERIFVHESQAEEFR